MKIVDAFWEKRNLGVDAVSFHIEEKDALDEILPIITSHNQSYQTAIIDPTKPEIMIELQNHGFKFIECALSLYAPVSKIHIPDNLKRFQSQMGYHPASKDEYVKIKTLIENGDIFKTDKISLDPVFGTKMAGIRYSLWIEDLIKTGSTLYSITFRNEVIAFDVSEISDGVVEHHLGGMLPSKAGKMLGATISIPALLFWINQGAKEFKTVVSSNNPSILKIHQSFGFEITGCKHILIKHII